MQYIFWNPYNASARIRQQAKGSFTYSDCGCESDHKVAITIAHMDSQSHFCDCNNLWHRNVNSTIEMLWTHVCNFAFAIAVCEWAVRPIHTEQLHLHMWLLPMILWYLPLCNVNRSTETYSTLQSQTQNQTRSQMQDTQCERAPRTHLDHQTLFPLSYFLHIIKPP